ncbi:MAG: cytochrome c oxidase subunit I [Ktedonobacteraceae bacterium]
MSSTSESTSVTAEKRPGLMSNLIPSIVSGIVLGVIGAVIAGVLIYKITTAYSPDGVPNDNAVTSAAIIGWAIFFMIGVGAFNGIFEWGFGRQELTHAQEMQMAGKGKGLWRYFQYTTDHKVVGLQYLITALILFFVGSLGAFSIRLEQSRPGAIFFNPSTYNTIVGMHGIIMIVATIIMITGPVGNFVVPIMIGARDMAFPRLNALSYWLLFVDVPVILSTLFLGGFQTGWTGYAPLAVQGLTPGMLSYNFFIIIFAISTTIAAMNIMVTILIMRTRGMTWGRLPITVWGVFFSVALGLMAFPFFLMVHIMVVIDRVYQTSFFLAASGGSNFLYQHLFWFFGHPEVYVILLPSLAVVAEIAVVFTRKPVFGYRLIIASMLGISILSVIVWGHHLYTSGSQDPLNIPFMLDTELISIPTGVFFLALIGTIWRGKIWVTVPMLFVFGLLVNFVIGGITGVYLADLPTDELLHGGMFVTAHFHFTLVGAAVFGFFASAYFWWPKMVGKRLNPLLGYLHFWLFEIGFLGTFLSLFMAGLQGEPRWSANIAAPFVTANTVASLFTIVIAASVFVFIFNVIYTFARGEAAEANEWGGKTLEWAVPTPVPLENFEELPVVTSSPYTYGEPVPALEGSGSVAEGGVEGVQPQIES